MAQDLHLLVDRSRQERFVQLFLQHERRIRAFILTMVPHWADADDLLQETSAVIWRKFDGFEPGTDFIDWALRIAHFEVLNYRKRQQRDRLRFSDQTIEILAARLRTFGEESDLRCEALQRCLLKLNPRDRELVQLRYGPEATTREVAARVGRSLHAVYKALNRIHGQLFDCVRRSLRRDELG
jgi:RNA polymerase sigma-70 factor (ECF subfamily)